MATGARDFQWTCYDKRPPPPSLPPWASTAQSSPLGTDGDTGGGGWRRPTSYFGAMKRLPTHAVACHDELTQDPDDQERGKLYGGRREPGGRRAEDEEERPSLEPDEEMRRHEWNRSNGELRKSTTNQRDDEAEELAHPLPVTDSSTEHDPQTETDDFSTLKAPPLVASEAFFRPWKRTNNNNDSDGGDDGEATANKWKVRALLNPFAKRKATKSSHQKLHAEPEETDANDRPAEENPAEPSPKWKPRAIAHSPPSRRVSISTKPVGIANEPPAPLPRRPRTPTQLPAPISASQPQYQEAPLARPVRPLRSRDTMQLAQLPALAADPRFGDKADLPLALASITDLRRSTAQLAPLEAVDQLALGRAEPRIQSAEDDDDVAKVLKIVPPKPPTQLQQLKQLQQHQKQKAKKGATLDALNEIKRKREERRNAQAEEKQRIKTELEEHGDDAGYKFRRLIQKYRDNLPSHQKAKQTTSNREALAVAPPSSQRLCVFVRKRPLAKKELKAKGYDILTCLYAGKKSADGAIRRELMCHEPKLKVDCSEALENHQFHFDGVFDDDQDNETVYTTTVGPLVPFLVQFDSGSSATSLTVFAYGQTGSGKTYTMKSIYRQAASDLFERLGAADERVSVGVSFYEIYMNQVNDLLNLRTRVQLMEDGDGVVQLLGLIEIAISSADELMELIKIGEEARATSANAVHDDSSRSHALLRVTITSASSGVVLARLSMVDLAGSERACDTQSDAKSTRMEGAEINKSLLALKECIRALDRGATHIPFRQSKLTQLLRDSFLCANSKTVMIATVSPCSDSCNHTLNTLRYADRLKEIGAN